MFVRQVEMWTTDACLPSEGERRKSGRLDVTVNVVVAVRVDPRDVELLELLAAGGSESIADVVRCEIQSNLDSVSYVCDASVRVIREEDNNDHQNCAKRQR